MGIKDKLMGSLVNGIVKDLKYEMYEGDEQSFE